MEKIGTGKLMTHMDRVFSDERPITADFFLTNFCDNNCKYCSYKKRFKNTFIKPYMSYTDFKKYLQKARKLGVEGVILTGGGEPTLNPDFDKIAKFLDKRIYHWGVNTNFNELKLIRPDFLKVSLDGWDEDSYYRVRGVRRYKKTVENIKQYAIWKKVNSPDTSLGIQMVATSVTGVRRFYEANKDLDVDYISFRPVESVQTEYYKNLPKDANTDPYMIQFVLQQLRREDPRVLINYKWGMIEKSYHFCPANWTQLAIDTDGNVMYCCHKPNEIVGNIMDRGILDKKAHYPISCSKCPNPCRLSGPNVEYRELEKNLKRAYFV